MASIDLPDLRNSDAVKGALKSILAALTRLVGTGLAVIFVVGAGIGSSRYAIDHGWFLVTETNGPWRHWISEGRTDSDPYTRAHLAKSGALRIASDSAGIYEARYDTQGARLHSSCDYVIEGTDMGRLWWSIAVFDQSGELIANDAARYTFTRDTAAINPDGTFIVTLGRDARPGNWLPTSGAGRLVLVFTVLDPATGLSDEARAERSAKLLPTIRRDGCS
jgi:hypothetical protein